VYQKSRSGRSGEEKKESLRLPGINPDRPARSLVTILSYPGFSFILGSFRYVGCATRDSSTYEVSTFN